MNNLIIFATGQTVNKVGGGGNLNTSVTSILSAIIAALGLVAVVVMIIGGYNYMTSAGDTNKVEKGKKTILYGAIGLIVCALSFVIVNFVIGTILKQGTDTSDSTTSASDYTTKTTCQKAGFTWDDKNKKCK